MKEIKGKAICLTEGLFYKPHAKTTHGLIRGTKRFDLQAVIDSTIKEDDAGLALDGNHKNIPVFDSVKTYLQNGGEADYCIIGVATAGGILPPDLKVAVIDALHNGISIINGLHTYLNEDPEFQKILESTSAVIHDI